MPQVTVPADPTTYRDPMTSTPRPQNIPQHSVRACAEYVGAAVVPADAAMEFLEAAVTGISHDSQAIRPGDLYIAWPGAARHGAEFAPGAVDAGAVAVVTDAAGAAMLDGLAVPVLVAEDVRALAGRLSAYVYGEPATHLAMYGVTGTNGKTTTSYLIDGGLRRAGLRTGVIGTVQILIGDEVVPSVRTTPESPDLQAILATAVEKGVDAVAMEVSSHALTYGRTAGIRFKAAAFLNLTQDHLDFHADFEDYFEAKAKLFTPGYTERAVVDVDDEHGRRIVERCRANGVEVHTFSIKGEAANWTAEAIELGADASTFTVVGPDGGRHQARAGLPGDFNVANALAAIVLLAVSGIELETAIAGVGDVHGVPGRMERVQVPGQEFLAVVDYAHTPDAVETALRALRPVAERGHGRLRVVVGCGGDRDKSKRPLMGAAAVRLADEAVFTDDNPRTESSADILAAVTAGADAELAGADQNYRVVADRAEAIASAVAASGPGDVLIVAGKGHEQGQEIAGVKKPFDDRVVLRAALEASAGAIAAGAKAEKGHSEQ
ncbi:UDP-N-acetylmuramoyl-L-alanyl-D-glutamate--2,6-diaminopimelate ligase [Catenulispora sp. EB89]|uniref:UDP-N-acetylmuramoyl-L-alanyl-D-glutamate--2, 6-diaminopimelate ligase n=1 Tax=Catenulispora sp. EB89 TaxID=3156257 RepID=UPI003514D19E